MPIYLPILLISCSIFCLPVQASCESLERDLRNNHPIYQRGPFPKHEDALIGITYTNSCEPIKGLQQAQKILRKSPGRPFNTQLQEDGRCRLIPQNTMTESVLKRVHRGQDGRTRITITQEFPYSFHGHMIMQFDNGKEYVGSGVLIGPHHVLTAGHNLFSHKAGEGWATKVTFIPAHNEDDKPFGEAQGAILLNLKNWVDHRDQNHDLGMVILDEAIGYRTGWAGVFGGPDTLLKKQTIHVTGYPGDKGEADKESTQMWTMNHQINSLSDESLNYAIDTYGGQSGSAVWTQFMDYVGYHVIAIHTYGTNDLRHGFNSGTRLSKEKLQRVLHWLEAYQITDMIHPSLPSLEEKRKKALLKAIKQGAKQEEKDSLYALADYYYLGRQLVENSNLLKDFWYYDLSQKRRVYYGIGRTQVTSIDYEKAAKLYEQAALKSHIEALVDRAECCELGRGIKVNLTNAELLYRRAIEQNNARAQNSLGSMYRNGHGVDKNDVEAVNWFRKAADQGLAKAQHGLGVMYDNGQGVGQDYIEALSWYRKAAEQGLAAAQNNLGGMYYNGHGIDKNDVEAVNWFHKAAEQGLAHAQHSLGAMYQNGHGVDKNYTQALSWYRKAADQGLAKAQHGLGVMYDNGQGVGQDYIEALSWYRKAAEQGFAHAQYGLGVMYESGDGITKNDVEAINWFRKAAEQGLAKAQNHLGAMYHNGDGIDKNYTQALNWLRKAAEQGLATAQNNLGVMYENGQGVDKNYTQALNWYRKAAEQGIAGAQHGLGFMYHNGQGVDKNYTQALSWYRKAADQGIAGAQNGLGFMYHNGQGVNKNDVEALSWFHKAADQGLANAQYNLGVMYQNGQGVAKNRTRAIEWYQKAAEKDDLNAINALKKI